MQTVQFGVVTDPFVICRGQAASSCLQRGQLLLYRPSRDSIWLVKVHRTSSRLNLEGSFAGRLNTSRYTGHKNLGVYNFGSPHP